MACAIVAVCNNGICFKSSRFIGSASFMRWCIVRFCIFSIDCRLASLLWCRRVGVLVWCAYALREVPQLRWLCNSSHGSAPLLWSALDPCAVFLSSLLSSCCALPCLCGCRNVWRSAGVLLLLFRFCSIVSIGACDITMLIRAAIHKAVCVRFVAYSVQYPFCR